MADNSIWESDRDYLREAVGAEITDKRIRKIAFLHNGKVRVAELGRPDPDYGIAVRAIYEDSQTVGRYLICAASVSMVGKTMNPIVEEEDL